MHGTFARYKGKLSPQPTRTQLATAEEPCSSSMAEAKWGETAMIVISMQKDFLLPAMGSRMLLPGGEAIIPSVVQAVTAARERGMLVIWVVREHDPLGRDVELFRRHLYRDGKGPVTKGTVGAELVDELVIKEGDYKVVKTRFSAFFATNLHSLLQTSGIMNIVVVGIATGNCVRQTVYDAVALDYQHVTVIEDATADNSPQSHSDCIRDMKRIKVATLTLQEWLQL